MRKKELVACFWAFLFFKVLHIQPQRPIFHRDAAASSGAFAAIGEDIVCRYVDPRLMRIQ